MSRRNCLCLVPSVSRGWAHRINFFSVDVIFLSLSLFFFLLKQEYGRQAYKRSSRTVNQGHEIFRELNLLRGSVQTPSWGLNALHELAKNG